MTTPLLLRRLLAALACSAASGLAFAANNIVSGSATLVQDGAQHPNGNVYDQVLLTGQTATLQADGQKILRCSFLDTNGDIVQVEFSGPGQVTITLDAATFVAAGPATKYSQAGVNYVTGKPTVTVVNNTADTYLNIFSVGTVTAVDQSLFLPGETYDGLADVQLVQLSGPTMGALFLGNTRFSAASGMTGIFAPNTSIVWRAVVHDVEASGSATPVLQFGSGSTFTQDSGSILLAGGDLVQANSAAIDVTAGSGSTLASIVTVSNVRSNNTAMQRVTLSSTINWISGGSGTILIDGTAVVDTTTGGTSGTFAATFSDLLASSNSPFNFSGDINIKWVFSGGNNGTWSVETSTTTSGISITSKISGTYTYSVSNNGGSFTFTLNYDQISAGTSFGPPLVLPINASSNPALPKSISMTATSTGTGLGTYQYTLTMSNGAQTNFSGNFSPTAPLTLPSS